MDESKVEYEDKVNEVTSILLDLYDTVTGITASPKDIIANKDVDSLDLTEFFYEASNRFEYDFDAYMDSAYTFEEAAELIVREKEELENDGD